MRPVLAVGALKLALYRSSLRRPFGWVSLLGSIAMSAVVASRIALPLASPPDGLPGAGGPYLVTLFALSAAGWLMLSVLTITSGEMMPAGLLAGFPLAAPQRALGLFLAAVLGVTPIATLIGLGGALAGFGVTPVSVAAVVLATVFCVSLNLLASALMGAAMRSRRGRDLGVVIGGLCGALAWFLYREAGSILHGASAARGSSAIDLLSATPPGSFGRAITAEPLAGLGLLALGAVETLAMLVLWAWLVDRSLTRDAVSAGSARRAVVGRLALPLRLLDRLGDRRAAAVCSAEVRATLRDPRRLTQYVSGLVLAGAFVGILQVKSGGLTPLFAGWAAIFLLQTTAPAQFAFDADATWAFVVAHGRPRSDLLGKNLALCVCALPLLAAITVGLMIVTDDPLSGPGAFLAACGAVMAWLGAGSIASVRAPVGIPIDPTKVPKPSAGLKLLGLMGLCMLAVVPAPSLAYGGEVAWGSSLLGGVAALAYGAIVWRIGFGRAARRLERRHPEIAAALMTT